ncbi:GNAT family N-acetyltransferase [Meiothermus sp.]|uniref:GNAT family N-acetyltransferase n=1 Tax=Meiothermus sp. TaxID=1955249 RepID=UPI00307EF598
MPERYIPPPTPQYALESGPILLKDGRTATLRPARPEDRALFVEFLERLSPQARTFRFFSEVRPETAADLLLKKPEGEDKVTLVVLSGDPERIIATGEYVQEGTHSTSAEVAFLVDDWFQGKGLGSLLLERLALMGVQRGIRRFHAFTLAENRQMLDVFKASGFKVESHTDSGEVEVSFDIEPNPEMIAKFELRERVSTVASLMPVLRPRGVAVVGASRDARSVGYQVLEHLVLNRFQGPVYPVNTAATPAAGDVPVVGSMLAYTSIKAVPGPIDLAIVTTPRDKVLEVAEACGQRGVRALMVVTTDMEAPQVKSLVQTCRHYGMRLVGPGSLALISTSPEIQLCAGLAATLPLRGRIAMSSQSGAVGLAVLEYAREMGLGFSNFVSLGAKVDISSNDLIQFWEEDPDTGLVLLYVESFGNPRRFARLARRMGRKKPILAVRPGRDAVVEALFKQTGVVRAESLEEMFDIAALLAHQPLPEGPKVALLTNASGPALLALEALKAEGLTAEVRDLGSRASAEEYLSSARELLSGSANAAMALFVPLGYATLEEVSEALRTAFAEAREKGIHIPVLTCFMTAGRPRVRLGAEWVPSYRFPESAGRALAAAYAYAQWRKTPPGEIPDHGVQEDEARALVSKTRGRLNPAQTAELLGYFGLRIGTPSPEGIALALRVKNDPLFGSVLTLALTGLPLGEQRLGIRITPLTDLEAQEMLAPLANKAHLESLQDILLRVSRMVEELPEIAELELSLSAAAQSTTITQARLTLRE